MSFQTDLYDDLVQQIVGLTARPDLEIETEIALRTATNNAHFSDAYWRDIITTPVQLPNASYMTQLNVPTLFPRMRGLTAIRPLDINYAPILLSPENRLQIVEYGDLYDSYGKLRNNIAYLAGDSINIRSSINSYGFIIDWLKAPLTKREEYNSWIAQLYQDVILYWAASIVLDTNGNEEKANKYMKLTQQIHIPYLKANFLLGEIR